MQTSLYYWLSRCLQCPGSLGTIDPIIRAIFEGLRHWTRRLFSWVPSSCRFCSVDGLLSQLSSWHQQQAALGLFLLFLPALQSDSTCTEVLGSELTGSLSVSVCKFLKACIFLKKTKPKAQTNKNAAVFLSWKIMKFVFQLEWGLHPISL